MAADICKALRAQRANVSAAGGLQKRRPARSADLVCCPMERQVHRRVGEVAAYGCRAQQLLLQLHTSLLLLQRRDGTRLVSALGREGGHHRLLGYTFAENGVSHSAL